MKTREEFEIYYETVITAQLEQLHELRLKIRRKKWLTRGIILSVFLLDIYVVWNIDTLVSVIAFIFIFFASIPFYYSNIRKALRLYEYYFKDEIITGIISFMQPDFTYDPQKGIPVQGFMISGLFGEPRKYFSNDEVDGYIGDTHLKFSYVKTAYFEGILLIMTFYKPFSSEIYIRERLIKNDAAAGIIDSLSFGRYSYLLTGDQEFDRNFEVTAEEHEEAKTILTPQLRSNILNFRSKTGYFTRLSFVRDRIFFPISLHEQFLQPKMSRDPNKNDIYKWYHTLTLAFSVPDMLGLNAETANEKLI